MNLTVEQIKALSQLIESVEAMIELYWDTENGARLSKVLQEGRTAFHGGSFEQLDGANSGKARLVVEAHCPTCSHLKDDPGNGLANILLALEHSCSRGHVVILNGTTDLRLQEELGPDLTALSASSEGIS